MDIHAITPEAPIDHQIERIRDCGMPVAEQHHAVYEDDADDIAHAQLTFGSGGMIMLGSVHDTPYGQYVAQPDEAGGRSTQSVYARGRRLHGALKAHYQHARARGAGIVLEYEEKDHGGGYSCRDLEGHLWSFGSYDPWQARSPSLWKGAGIQLSQE